MKFIIAYFKCRLFKVHTYTHHFIYDPKLGRMTKVWKCLHCQKLVTERDK